MLKQSAIVDYLAIRAKLKRCTKPTTTEDWQNLNLQYKEAIPDFDKAIELDSKNADAYNNRGVVSS